MWATIPQRWSPGESVLRSRCDAEAGEGLMEIARRMRSIPPYLFADLDRKRAALRAKGVDAINIAIGDPDLPTPPHIIAALTEAARNPATHVYPPYEGTAEFRQEIGRA